MLVYMICQYEEVYCSNCDDCQNGCDCVEQCVLQLVDGIDDRVGVGGIGEVVLCFGCSCLEQCGSSF